MTYDNEHGPRRDQSWRAIENQIVRFFESQGCVVPRDGGDFFLCVLDSVTEDGDDLDCVFEVSLTNLARELADGIDSRTRKMPVKKTGIPDFLRRTKEEAAAS